MSWLIKYYFDIMLDLKIKVQNKYGFFIINENQYKILLELFDINLCVIYNLCI